MFQWAGGFSSGLFRCGHLCCRWFEFVRSTVSALLHILQQKGLRRACGSRTSRSLEIKFREALGLHQQGRLADAEQGYQAVLRRHAAPFRRDVSARRDRATDQTARTGPRIIRHSDRAASRFRRGLQQSRCRAGGSGAPPGCAVRLRPGDHRCSRTISARTTIAVRHWRAWVVSPRHWRAMTGRSRCSRTPPDAYMNQGADVGETGTRVRSVVAFRHSDRVAARPSLGFLQPRQCVAGFAASRGGGGKLRPGNRAAAKSRRGAQQSRRRAKRNLGRSEAALSAATIARLRSAPGRRSIQQSRHRAGGTWPSRGSVG